MLLATALEVRMELLWCFGAKPSPNLSDALWSAHHSLLRLRVGENELHRVDGEDILGAFACEQALGVAHLWSMPVSVRRYLKSCDSLDRMEASFAVSMAQHRTRSVRQRTAIRVAEAAMVESSAEAAVQALDVASSLLAHRGAAVWELQGRFCAAIFHDLCPGSHLQERLEAWRYARHTHPVLGRAFLWGWAHSGVPGLEFVEAL